MTRRRGITLLEMLIALTLVGVVSIGILSIDTFSRYQAVTASQRATLQEEAANAIEHMQKHIFTAIGDDLNWPIVLYPGNQGFAARLDTNQNGRLDPGVDQWVAYLNRNNQIHFYSGMATSAMPGADGEVIANHIRSVSGNNVITGMRVMDEHSIVPRQHWYNHIMVVVRTCWDPLETSGPCDDPTPGGVESGVRNFRNPTFKTQSRLDMPSVSVN
jgi:prepilin-type N-terminal cleavage/methylation domain-containing protein